MDSTTFWVTYRLSGVSEGEACRLARKICLEQTVEMDEDLVRDPRIADEVVGQIVAVTAQDETSFLARIAFDWRTTGREVPQWLNVLFGNSCFNPNVQLWDCDPNIPWLPGPRFGIEGLRRACNHLEGPMLCSALKPMGSSVEALAQMAGELVAGGLHVLKDDHGLANQDYHRFAERVRAVSRAVREAGDRAGHRCLYFPNFAPPLERLQEAIDICRNAEVPGLLVSPHLVGMDMVRYLREHTEFLLMLHPAWTGGHLTNPQGGVRPSVLLGRLFRALGGDGVIYPNFGGRFGFSREGCLALVKALRTDEAPFPAACPIPAGGLSLGLVPELVELYGPDVMFLIGSGLYRVDKDLKRAVAAFRASAGLNAI